MAMRSAAIHGRYILAFGLALVASLLIVVGPTQGATAVCPTDPLLSEEIGHAGSVFIGAVRGPSTGGSDEGLVAPWVEVAVEEIWEGPELAAVVQVANPDYGGRPPIVLAAGARYLFLAEPAEGADTPVAELVLPACSLTQPIAPELAGLRPDDVRVMPAFAPLPADASGPPVWPWALAAVLVVVTAATYLLRDRLGAKLAWVPWAAGAAAVTSIGIGAILALSPTETAVASPSASAAASLGSSATMAPGTLAPSGPLPLEDPALVVRIMDSGPSTGTFGRIVSIHGDGRVISSTTSGRVVQQVLDSQGVDAVVAAVAPAWGLVGSDATTASFRAVLRPGADPARGAYASSLVLQRDGAPVIVDWTPIPSGETGLWEPSEEIAILDGLADRLWDLDAWLDPEMWLSADPRPYEAARFRLTDEELMSGYRPEVALEDVRWPLDPPLDERPATRNSVGLLTRCVALSRGEATAVASALSASLGDPTLGLDSRWGVELAGETAGRNHRITIEPLMPDESGCLVATPSAGPPTLAAGSIAMVRVDGLRMRERPDPTGTVTDTLSAGQRVGLVTDSVAADGSRWWLVRQGPGDRQGWVSAGPPDGDPWLVAVGNGRIAVMEGSDRIRVVDPDGGGITTIGDGGVAAWSPDGTRLQLSVPPTDANPEWQLAIADADGSGLRRLADANTGAWSPDGSRIAFVRNGEDGPWVYVIDADGGAPQRVTAGSQPAWSPDGSALAVWRPDLSARPSEGVMPTPEALWVVTADGTDERQLTGYEVRAWATDPAWSPDGQFIATDDRLLSVDGTVVLQLDPGDTWAQQPWSPDGEDLIVIDSTPDLVGAGAISLLSVDTRELRVVVPVAEGQSLSQAVWSPDGRFLAFTEVRWTVDGSIASLGIRIVPAAGGEVTDLGVTDSQLPAWQPLVSHGLD